MHTVIIVGVLLVAVLVVIGLAEYMYSAFRDSRANKSQALTGVVRPHDDKDDHGSIRD